MKKGNLIVSVLLLLVLGCATISDHRLMNKFNDTSRDYRHAVIWSDYETARVFVKDRGVKRNLSDFQTFKRIKVTGYTVKQSVPSADKLQVRQAVEIIYFWQDKPVLKSINDNQIWEYDSTEKRWYLISGIPDFK